MIQQLVIATVVGCIFSCAAQASELRPAHAQKLCLDIKGGLDQPDGTQLIVHPCHGGANQDFAFLPDGTLRVGRRCVDIAGGAARSGDRVIVWPCNGGDNQRWRVSANGQVIGKNNLCLDVSRFGGSGTGIVAWSCKSLNEDISNEQWIIR